MNESVYSPILDLLADHKPRTIGQLEASLRDKSISLPQIIQALLVMLGARHVLPATEDNLIARARKQTDRLNSHLCLKARGSNDISHLASPVTGGGIVVTRIQQLFLLSLGQGRKQPSDWAAFAWQVLSSQGQRMIKDGKTLETPEENLADLNAQAVAFAEKQLPILKALQIA